MKYLGFASMIIILGLVFGLNLRGLAGALALGITVLTIDYGCLRLRIRLLRKNGTSLKLFTIVGVFLFRLLNIVVFLMVGSWWLVPATHQLFYWILITIPIWNLLGAFKMAHQP